MEGEKIYAIIGKDFVKRNLIKRFPDIYNREWKSIYHSMLEDIVIDKGFDIDDLKQISKNKAMNNIA